MIPLLLLFVTATYRPPTPTVGDLITIDYSQPVKVAPSRDYEVVSQNGASAVVRTFEPRPIVVRATAANGEKVGEVVIPIKSVLAPNDALKPAPLQPPRELPPSRIPWIAIGIAAACAALGWLLVWWRSKPVVRTVVEPMLPAEVRFRRAVADAARARRWSALADAVRAYLAEKYPELGVELTTEELLAKGGDMAGALRVVLRQGDLEKFSPWGPEDDDFEAAAQKALEIAA